MGLHGYCVTRPIDGPSVTGIGGAPVRVTAMGSVAMLVSEHVSRPDASMDAIQQHNNVVAAAMAAETPVPLRFGQWLENEDAVRAALSTSHEKWAGLLDRFQGRVEFGLRVFDPARAEVDPAAPHHSGTAGSGGSGTAYMAELARRIGGPKAAREGVVSALNEALSGLELEERVEALRTAHGVASVAHLVHRADIDAYRDAVDAVRARLLRLRLLSTGPWPPYSFVE